jgi:hypothetical protein
VILLEKLFNKYSKKELEGIFPRQYVYELINYRIHPKLTSIAGKVHVVNELNYAYEFPLLIMKTMQNIRKVSCYSISIKKGSQQKLLPLNLIIMKPLFCLFKNGILLNKGTKIEQMKTYYIEDKIDIKGMRYKIFDNHCELYAPKKELEKFRDKYNIDEHIIYSETKKTWHLAFIGYWFYLIKYNKIKGVL